MGMLGMEGMFGIDGIGDMDGLFGMDGMLGMFSIGIFMPFISLIIFFMSAFMLAQQSSFME